MATLATSQQWLHQSSLLIEARPHTTKISCRYSVKPKPARRVKKADRKEGDTPVSNGVGQNPRAKLVLKTVDPASGVCLKYETTKAAEVSRLVQLLGQLSRRQAGLVAGTATEEAEDVTMADAGAAATPAEDSPAQTPAPAPAQQQQPQQGGGGKGKKKKGKR